MAKRMADDDPKRKIPYPKNRRAPWRPYSEFPRTARICNRCHEMKPMASFYTQPMGRKAVERGWRPRERGDCRTCYKKRTTEWQKKNPDKARVIGRRTFLLCNYGITPEMYDLLLLEQGGGCAICGTHSVGKRWKNGRFHIDHDPTTGKVRGLLCSNCNLGLGQYRHTPKLLRKAARYLEKPPAAKHLEPSPDVGQALAMPQMTFMDELESR